MNKVVVGLGGVDSSTAAAILHHQGYEVIGLTLWLMKGKGQCCSEGMVDAAYICEQLGIPITLSIAEKSSRPILSIIWSRVTAPVSLPALLPVQQDGEVWPDGTVCPRQLGIDRMLRVTMNQLTKVRALSAAKGGRPE